MKRCTTAPRCLRNGWMPSRTVPATGGAVAESSPDPAVPPGESENDKEKVAQAVTIKGPGLVETGLGYIQSIGVGVGSCSSSCCSSLPQATSS